MKATNITASKTLRIINNIMEGPEWFAKDEHHSASLEYSRVAGDYEIFTAKFYGAGAIVRKLNFFDIDDALGYLASNHYYNVASNPAEESKPEAKTAIPELIGKKLHEHDTWYGITTITIDTIEFLGDTNRIKFTGTNSWGKEESIYIADNLLASLVETGEAETTQEIDHCTVRKIWTLQ